MKRKVVGVVNAIYTLPNMQWHKAQLELLRGQQAKEEAANSEEDFKILQREAASAIKRLEAAGFPDGAENYFSIHTAFPCYDHTDPNVSYEISQRSWDIGLVTLGANGVFYARHFGSCPAKDCKVQRFAAYPITAEQLRVQREMSVHHLEQEFLLEILHCLGTPRI